MDVKASPLLPKPKAIAKAALPDRKICLNIPAESSVGNRMWFVCHIHKKKEDGLIYLRGTIAMARLGA